MKQLFGGKPAVVNVNSISSDKYNNHVNAKLLNNHNPTTFAPTSLYLTDSETPNVKCISNQSSLLDGEQPSKMVIWEGPHASDNSGNVFVTCDPHVGSNFTIGQTIVTCNASDGSGNRAECYFRANNTGKYSMSSYLIFSIICIRGWGYVCVCGGVVFVCGMWRSVCVCGMCCGGMMVCEKV